jgi:hypothetical protein
MVTSVTILNGQYKTYKGRKSLIVYNTTVNSGGNATFTSQKNITFLPGFVAQAGSRVMAYIAPPDCDEITFQARGGMMDVTMGSTFSTKTTEIELLFGVDSTFSTEIERDSAFSTKTIEIEVAGGDDMADFISVFPNPANSTVTVQLHGGNSETSLVSVKFMDLLGRAVLSREVSEPSCVLDVSTCPKGFYFIEIKNETKSYYQKLIIQ